MAKPMSSIFCQLLSFFYLFSSTNALYNVLNFGAKADGKTDSASSFLKTWNLACGSVSPATVYVPSGTFLVGQVVFQGPCRNNAIKFLVDGTIIASSNFGGVGASGNWIVFDNVEGVSINGGRLDGRGKALWDCKLSGRKCPAGATSLRFSNSKNIEINGLTSVNSELYHIVILQCQGVRVNGANILAPGNSPNTDGIHVQMSTAVTIFKTVIRTGDDCISVGPGTSGLWIERVFCGPGHGISIGSLGKGEQLNEEGVQNVTVKSAVFSGAQNGLRIKTWATRTVGFVKGVTFENVVMQNVQNPIIIDQNYCPHGINCPNQSSHIKVSQVKYVNIRGTTTTHDAVRFDCSSSNPCSDISMQDIKLTYGDQQEAQSSCKHALGLASGLMLPPSCL